MGSDLCVCLIVWLNVVICLETVGCGIADDICFMGITGCIGIVNQSFG